MLDVAAVIGADIDGYKVVVNKSTVPVGHQQKVATGSQQNRREHGNAFPFDVCSNPEFLKEGSALDDFTKPSRIIIGTQSDTVRKLMRECYAPYNRNHDKLMFMDARSGGTDQICRQRDARDKDQLHERNRQPRRTPRRRHRTGPPRHRVDPRIGYHFIYPGCGYGGSCFPKDVRALASTAASVGLDDHAHPRGRKGQYGPEVRPFRSSSSRFSTAG